MALNLPVKMMEAKEQSSVFLIELYELHLKSGTLYLAACDQDIIFNGNKYKAVPIERGIYKTTVDSKVDNTQLKISNFDDSFTSALFQGYDFRGCRIYIYQILYPDALSDPTLVKPVAFGYLDTPVLDCKNAVFTVDVKADSPNLENARLMQLPCNSQFGDESCGITVVPISGKIGASSTQGKICDIYRGESDGYWQDGIITYKSESRKISSSTSGVLNLEYPFFITPTVGDTYTIIRGCNKTPTACKNRFDNLKHYSGMLAVPWECVPKS